MNLLLNYKSKNRTLNFSPPEPEKVAPAPIPRILSPQEINLQKMIEKNPKLSILIDAFGLDIDLHAPGEKAPPELPLSLPGPKYPEISLDEIYIYMDQSIKPERTYRTSEILDIMNNKILMLKAMDMFPSLIESGLLKENAPGEYYRFDSTPF